jgi:hypothetical protein
MLRFGGIASTRRRALVALPLVAVLTITTSAAYAADQWFKAGTIDSPSITESSGIAVSVKYPGYAYTVNDDEPDNKARIYTILVSSGAVRGVTTLAGVDPVDPEALSVDEKGRLWFADMGGDGNRWKKPVKPPTLYMFNEPGPTTRTVTPHAYPITYPSGKQFDVETLLVRPKTGDKYFITKDEPGQRLALYTASFGKSVKLRETMPDDVSDGAFTPNGKWAVLINNKKAYVYSSSNWRLHATVKIPDFTDFEGISFNTKGDRFLLTRDKNATADTGKRTFTLYWVKFNQTTGTAPKS